MSFKVTMKDFVASDDGIDIEEYERRKREEKLMTSKVENLPAAPVNSMLTGRPRKYDTPDEMAERIDAYFDACDNHYQEVRKKDKNGDEVVDTIHKPRPYTMAGLAIFLGFSSRRSLFNYKSYDGYGELIEAALTRIEEQRNVQLVSGQGQCGGLIFDLKNNHGWKDERHETSDVNVSGNIHVNGLNGAPPMFKSLEDWQSAYQTMLEQRKALEENTIDVTPLNQEG